MKKIDKKDLKCMMSAFALTLLLLVFAIGASAAVFRSAEVLYGEGESFSLRERNGVVTLTLFSEKQSFSLPDAERFLSGIGQYSSFVPLPLRSVFLSAGLFRFGANELLKAG